MLKKAAEEEKDAWSHTSYHVVMSIQESFKADLLAVQNVLENKLKELETDHKRIISTTDLSSKATDNLHSTTQNLENKIGKVNDTMDKLANTTMLYRDAIMANPKNRPRVDPKVLSGIDKKAKQILIEFNLPLDNPTRGTCTEELRGKANDIIKNLDGVAHPKDIHVSDLARTRDGSLLLLLQSMFQL